MNDQIIVSSIRNSGDWKGFNNLPWKINEADKNWVPPLRMSLRQLFDFKKNPFWKTVQSEFFIAKINNETVGRIAVIIINSQKEEKTGYFGFLEAINDKGVFANLFMTAEKWLKENGCKKITGPVNPSINYELGVLTGGFDTAPYYMLSHNPAYYNERILSSGYQKEKDFYSYYVRSDDFIVTEKMKRTMSIHMKRSNLTVRNINLKDFDSELKIFHDIYNDSFRRHWGFVPMNENEFRYMAKDLVQIMDKELVLVMEYNNIPVGFILTLPNMNEVFTHIRNGKLFPFGFLKFLFYRKKIKNVRILTVAIKEQYQHLGLGGFLYFEIGTRVKAKGYDGGEMSWVVEDNIQMNKLAREMGGKICKTYRIYSKNVG